MTIVLITGGSRGIGRATALACGRRGMGVIVTYKTNERDAETVVKQIEAEGGRSVALCLDVAQITSFSAFSTTLANVLKETWCRDSFDYLVNNAGVGGFEPIESVSESFFDHLMQVHLKGPFFLTQCLMPLMAEGGAIVNVTSATTRVATTGVAAYAACKGGLEVLTRYMAKEFGPRRIRANAISPGAIRTDLAGLDGHPDFVALLASQTSLGRVGEPEDVAGAISSLLSPENAWINAQTIEVAGGYCI